MRSRHIFLSFVLGLVAGAPDPESLPNLQGLAKTMVQHGPSVLSNLQSLQSVVATLLPNKNSKFYLDKNWLEEVNSCYLTNYYYRYEGL